MQPESVLKPSSPAVIAEFPPLLQGAVASFASKYPSGVIDIFVIDHEAFSFRNKQVNGSKDCNAPGTAE